MQMLNIVNKMPRRSFLPRVNPSKLPFSTQRLREVNELFAVQEGSATEHVILNALCECKTLPSQSETKQCVGFTEDMVDFASSVLDHGITVLTIENVNGSKQKVVIGSIKGIKGGQSTESSFNERNDTFKEYSNGSKGQTTIEPGIFFREFELRPGTVMQMLNIVDKMPRRSFLPRVNPSKLPFSTQRLREVKELFAVQEGSATEHVILNALCECKRPPSQGETKQCVGFTKDMVDFASSVLSHGITVLTIEIVNGSKQKVVIGSIKGIKGGQPTESVSCH
ncbi:hypothetical protein ACJRO7_035519 [Eucalyptus globulus]|uniref:BURP domain-containing protein n=1 Tax=Eucalyptus globulus TaxID=34317 RepID=A0ABD3J6F6_EUCGL